MIYLLARRLFISFHLHFLRLFDPALNDACLVFEDCWWISLFVSTRMGGKNGLILISDMNACDEMMEE